MRTRPSRPILVVVAAAALSLLGGPMAGAIELPPGVTLPPRPSDTSTTTAPPAPPTTLPPSTVAPTTVAPPPTTVAPTPTTAPETKLILVPPATAAPGAAPTTAMPGETSTASTVPPASLSPGQVDAVLRDQQRTGASSTGALIEALRPLQNLGMTAEEAMTLGMGQFPVLGLANWTDDWLDPRSGPPPHQHQGTDIFSAFDTPVRAPVDGTLRFEDSGLGGKGAFVTAPDGTYYYMAHLNSFSPGLANGAPVKQGQVVGFNGDSGNARGGAPHVHLQIHPRGGAAVNPKPFLDAWLEAALAQAPALIASFQPPPAAGESANADGGVPQILMTTGLTRRFSAPSLTPPHRERPAGDFNRAVLRPLTPTALAPLLDP